MGFQSFRCSNTNKCFWELISEPVQLKPYSCHPQGDILSEASKVYPVEANQPGWAETNPKDWWQGAAIAVKQVLEVTSEPVEAIGLSGQMHGIVLTDQACRPLGNAILWADNRSSSTLGAYQNLEPDLRHCLGNPITAGMAGPTLLWLRDHEPNRYQSANWAFQPKDWVRSQLTGEVAAEPSDASGTLLYDVIENQWATPAIDALGLRAELLPPLIESSAIAGELTSAAAEHLGLTGLASRWWPGLQIQPVGPWAMGCYNPVCFNSRWVAAPKLSPSMTNPRSTPQYRTHLFRTALPNQWYSLAAIQNAGITLEWVRKLLGLDWAQVYKELPDIPPGCAGLTFFALLKRRSHSPSRPGCSGGLGGTGPSP